MSEQTNELTVLDRIAIAAMEARLAAGWANPQSTNTAFRRWAAAQPPSGRTDYNSYIAEEAYDAAEAMMRQRVERIDRAMKAQTPQEQK